MLATVPSATLLGVDGHPVIVEVHVSNGLPTFTIVGLPDTSCREARDRVRSALLPIKPQGGRSKRNKTDFTLPWSQSPWCHDEFSTRIIAQTKAQC